jgi:hypothetical protein
MKFDVKYILGIAIRSLQEWMRSFMWVYNQDRNIQSDVKGVRSARNWVFKAGYIYS